MSNYSVESWWASAAQDITYFSHDIGIMATSCDDGTAVWFNGVIPAWQEGWIKAVPADGKLVFASGQLMSSWAVGDIYMGGAVYNPRKEEYTLVESFALNINPETGTLTLADTDSGERVYMLAYLDNGVIMEVEYGMTFTPFGETKPEPPAEAELGSWIRTYFDDISKFPYTDVVKVATLGNEIWLEGFSGATQGFVKGEILPDGSISIPSGQLTVAACGTYINRMYAGKKNTEDNQIYPSEALVLAKDGDGYASGLYDYLRFGFDQENIEYQYKHYMLTPYDLSPRTPQRPSIGVVQRLTEEYPVPGHFPGDIYMTVEIPDTDVDGDILDHDCLAYRIYIDGEPYTFSPEDYTSLTEPVVEMPYDFSDMRDITHMGMHTIYLKKDEIGTVGIESVYTAGGEKRVSEMDTIDAGLTSVEGVQCMKAVVREEWHDMLGRAVASPAGGVFVRTRVFEDGSRDNALVRRK